MFFFLSKILTFLISPIVIIIVLLFAAAIVKNSFRRKRILIASIALLILFTNPYIIDQLHKRWELRYSNYTQEKHYEAAIVLSGFMSFDEDLNRMTFGESVDRLTEGLVLYRKGQIDKIIISGGSGSMIKDIRESAIAKDFLVDYCAVPDSIVIIDTLSRNTYENAVESKKLMKSHQIQSALLITSAFHMRRAKGCFDRLGINTDIYATDVSPKQEYYPSDLFIPSTRNLVKWETLMHEVIGVIIYKIQGYN